MNRIALFAALVLLSGCSLATPSNGNKIGQFVKVSKEGIMCKTWEAEFVRGGFQGGSGTTGASFHVTIESEELAKQAERYMNEQRELNISYRTEGVVAPCRAESGNNFLVSIDTAVNTVPKK